MMEQLGQLEEILSTARRSFSRSRYSNCCFSVLVVITTVAQSATEEYNGTAWTAGGNLTMARSSIAGCGITNCLL
jgi:hypothetical protein